MVWVSAAGLFLFFVNMLFSGMDTRSASNEKESLMQEINSLKAKMFDLQDANKSVQAASTTSDSADDLTKNKPEQED